MSYTYSADDVARLAAESPKGSALNPTEEHRGAFSRDRARVLHSRRPCAAWRIKLRWLAPAMAIPRVPA